MMIAIASFMRLASSAAPKSWLSASEFCSFKRATVWIPSHMMHLLDEATYESGLPTFGTGDWVLNAPSQDWLHLDIPGGNLE